MKKIIEILQNLPKVGICEKIEEIFFNLLQELEEYLNLENVNPNVRIAFHKDKKKPKKTNEHILDLSAFRNLNNTILTIEIFDQYREFLPIILLREAFYCFIPNSIKDYEAIKLLLNQVVESSLRDIPLIKKWKSLIRPYIIDYDEDSLKFNRIEKFFSLEGIKEDENPITFSLEFIRKNVLSIEDNKDELYNLLFKEFVFKTSKMLKNDELVETIRVLIEIFYKVKKYSDLLDYKRKFQDFKKQGFIKTDLSLRKFTENIRWIHQYSYISPSYQINWKEMDMCTISCTLRFHPRIDKKRIDHFIHNLPFFIWSNSTEINFSIEVFGWFNLPSSYVNDLTNFLEKLRNLGYLIEAIPIIYNYGHNFLNLNYFREYYKKGTLIDRKNILYDNKYEISFELEHSREFNKKNLSLLDFLVLDRIRHWSVSGFTFIRRADTLKILKSDLFSEILKSKSILENLKKNFYYINRSDKLKNFFLNFIHKVKELGFFYLENFLKVLIRVLEISEDILKKKSTIKKAEDLHTIFKTSKFTKKIEEIILLRDKAISNLILKNIIPKYFSNIKEYDEIVRYCKILNEVIQLCQNLKILDLNTIEQILKDNELISIIFRKKKKKHNEIYKEGDLKDITTNSVDNLLNSYIQTDPPLIKPILINTINTTNFANYYVQMYLRFSGKSMKIIHDIKQIFPRVIFSIGENLFSNEKIIDLQIYLPSIISKEKVLFLSALKKLFNEDLIKLKRYFNDGLFKSFSRKEFYDFEKKEFFYTEDLFKEFYKFTYNLFDLKIEGFRESKNDSIHFFWSKNIALDLMIQEINNRENNSKIGFNVIDLRNLSNLNKNLDNFIIDRKEFQRYVRSDFFIDHIKKISFFPKFQVFGLGQYYLYMRPIDLEFIDYKLLFLNTFQKIQFAASIGQSNSFLIKYLFPYRNPNQAYLNWLVHSKKIISEYFLFFIKKIYTIFHFDYNFTSKGWTLDFNYFKSYMQKVLFNPSFKVQDTDLRNFDLMDLKNFDEIGSIPESEIFKNFNEIYKMKSLDIKDIILHDQLQKYQKFKKLMKKKLVFPYIELKNLGIKERIYIIVPDLKEVDISIFTRIFSFFNFGFIYEIEGSFYLYGFEKTEENKNGIMIELDLPDCDIGELKRILSSLFQYLKIDKYLIISDLVEGENLLNNVYGDLSIFEEYNPLVNLKWSEKDKKWLNHKLFTEKFEPIYPCLFKKQE